MGLKVQQYIRSSTDKVPHVYKAIRYQRKEKNKESVLIYFWGAAAAALLISCIYLVEQQVKNENAQKSFAKVTIQPVVTPPPVKAPIVIEAVVKEPLNTTVPNDSSTTDKSVYKTAMTYFQKGNLDEAMPRFTQLTTVTTSPYNELARYQLAICFKFKAQKAKARSMFKELVNMNGSMKRRAQLALNKL